MSKPFIDTNVILRFLIKDPVNPHLSEESKKIFGRISHGELSVLTSPLVIAECYVVLERIYDQSKTQISQLLSSVLSLDDFNVSDKARILSALETSREKNIDFVDAMIYHTMLDSGIATLLTYDKHFNRLDEISTQP